MGETEDKAAARRLHDAIDVAERDAFAEQHAVMRAHERVEKLNAKAPFNAGVVLGDPDHVADATDWHNLQGRLSREVRDAIKSIVDGADADLRRYADALATSLALAIQQGRISAAEEIHAQAKLLLAVNRIRASAKFRDVISIVINAIIRMALSAGVTMLGQSHATHALAVAEINNPASKKDGEE